MGRFHFARAAILACVTGFGKSIVPLVGLGLNGGCRNGSKLMSRFRENRCLHNRCEFGDWVFIVLLIVLHGCGFFVRFTFVCVNLNNTPSGITIMHPKKQWGLWGVHPIFQTHTPARDLVTMLRNPNAKLK